MKTIRTCDRLDQARSEISRIIGHGTAKTLDAETYQLSDGRVCGIREAGPRGWLVVELTKEEGTQCRLGQLHRLVDEQFGFAAMHVSMAAEAAKIGDKARVRARMSQAFAHTNIAIEKLEEILSLVIETTGESVGEEPVRAA